MILINNCNSIDNGSISILPEVLNVKYAINGTGKSTVAKAIELTMKGTSLAELKPFKYRDSSDTANEPSVAGLAPGSIMLFNDEYVSQFVFKADEVLTNSFEIFVKTESFVALTDEIEQAIADIRKTFHQSSELDEIISDMEALIASFGKPTKKKGYAENSPMARGPGKGNKIQHIPSGLEGYSLYLQSDANTKWIKWQLDGHSFDQNPGHCPYCTSSTEEMKDTIMKVGEVYDANYIGHITQLTKVMERLRDYFSSPTEAKIEQVIKSPDQLEDEHYNFLLEVKDQGVILLEKLKSLKFLGFVSMKDVGKLEDMFSSMKIDISFLSHLESQKTKDITDPINVAIDGIMRKITPLKAAVGKQKSNIRQTIQRNKKEINEFLKTAGYKYEVDVDEGDASYKMRLRHVDHAAPIVSGAKHLSYGEKNAFSLVLFMYECLARNPGLIVLDDPISSFDKNKKYAVLNMLFRGDRCLKGRAVLMLTHDFEPVIDIGYTLKNKFSHPHEPFITFLRNRNGVLTEKVVASEDIKTFQVVCRENIDSAPNVLVKVIFLRRFVEIGGEKDAVYHLLSNLFHKRANPRMGAADTAPLMDAADVTDATNRIATYIPGFSYATALTEFTDETFMLAAYSAARSNYEKLQIFRIHKDGILSGDDVIDKFINEVFHIENDYIMQLDPSEFEIVPDYVIAECDRILGIV
ncbi:AAA family ATPase [Luteolibacter sp. GHJ8]|uniref:AAA family ATPase n=1 Tax=Luteolibacter rhizosphaerae TaxID=2989719 RepID=A0ABT3G0N9_9BACT|nr:AAA family ATPase [Luteolibacter rhizosphaerae]MCW1913081.1 AAA family ATPase [Luteolibacter rhizosphaerae]